ncbi:MAG: hypothetical protein SFX73_22735 [Kofleriaceae bacterium]|nr:hypothetical protein [Kofleriaceae bacterium]
MTAGTGDAAYTVLYDGPGLGGRTTTVEIFSPLQRGEDRGTWVSRLAKGVPFRVGNRNIQLRLVMPHFSNLAVGSIDSATKSETPWVAEVGRVVANNISRVQGVVLLVDSRSVRLDASLERLELTLAEIVRAGLDPNTIPFVFQLNHRDSPYAVSIDEVKGALKTAMPPRVAFVESVAARRYGTHQTFETIVAMIDGQTPPILSGERRVSPRSVPELFQPFETALTLDGLFRERLETRSFPNVIHLKGKVGVARGWPKYDGGVLEAANASYAVDVVERHVEQKKGEVWSPLHSRPSVMAARMRCVDREVARFESFISVERALTPFVLVGPKAPVKAAQQFRFGAQETYNVADRIGFAVEDGVVLFNVGTLNHAMVWVGYDAKGCAVDITIYGDHAIELMRS